MLKQEHYHYLIIIIALVCLYRVTQYDPKAIDVSFSLVKKIFPEGNYSWLSEIGPTNLYPEGAIRKGSATFKHNYEENSVTITTNYVLIDKSRKKPNKDCKRITKYFYKPDHGNNLFRKSITYSNGQEVNTTYGYAIRKTSNSFSFKISASTQYSTEEFNQLEGTISRPEKGIVRFDWKNYNIFGLVNFTSFSEYKLIK